MSVISFNSSLSEDSNETVKPAAGSDDRYIRSSTAKERALFNTVKSPEQFISIDEATRINFITASVVNLLGIGAHPNTLDDAGITPIHYAALRGHQGAIEALLAANVHPDNRDTDGNAPMSYAAFGGHKACVLTLIKACGNPNAENVHKKTPLAEAWDGGHSEMIDLLTSKTRKA